eukprot:3875798-Amphidinium_carterae.1
MLEPKYTTNSLVRILLLLIRVLPKELQGTKGPQGKGMVRALQGAKVLDHSTVLRAQRDALISANESHNTDLQR